MNRRPSLPGVEELFGSVGRRPSPGGDEEAAAPAELRSLAHLLPPEDDAVAAARRRAGDLAPSPGLLALLRWAAVTCGARAVVEVGASGGVTASALLDVLAPKGVLTSIEPDPQAHGLAAATFREVGAGPRIRSIQDEPTTVLPRLADAGYDLVLLQTEPEGPELLDHVRRLLRSGGLLLAVGVAQTTTAGAAAFVEALAADEAFQTAVLPGDGGIALATRLEDPSTV